MLIVIGTSPFHDTSVAVGPLKTSAAAHTAADDLTYRGWNTEIVELVKAADVHFLAGEKEDVPAAS